MKALHSASGTGIGYNPGVSYQGGQFLAQGIGQAGNALAEGLQRYAANKEESAALDTRFESTARPLMEKLKLYGQLADENSPAAALLDKSADWHKLGTSQKKVLLADMMLLGDKTEAEQRRKADEQYKLLTVQHQQAQEEMAQKHLALQGTQLASDALFRGLAAWQSNRSHTLAEQTRADTLARFAAADKERQAIDADTQGAWQHIARYSTAPGGIGPVLPMSQTVPEALSQFPRALKNNNLDNVLGVLGRYSPQAEADHVPKIVDLDGVKTIYSPKGGQFQLAPSSSLPADLPEVPGHTAVPNGRGGVAYVKNGELTDTQRHSRLAAQERVLLNSISRALSEEEKTGYRRQLRGVQEDIRAIEAGGANRTPAPAAATAAPAPATQFKPGERARQNGVTYEFDGRTWNPIP